MKRTTRATESDWRIIVDFREPMASRIKGFADELGVSYQAAIKLLCDEALRERFNRKMFGED